MGKDVIIACDFKNKEELFKFLEPFKGLNPSSAFNSFIIRSDSVNIALCSGVNGKSNTPQSLGLTPYVSPNMLYSPAVLVELTPSSGISNLVKDFKRSENSW